jgi:hypothetical protein
VILLRAFFRNRSDLLILPATSRNPTSDEEIVMSAPVETKVKAASVASLVSTFIVAWFVYKAPGLASLADPIQAVIVGAFASASTWAAGWLAKHSPRPVSNDQTARPTY